MDHPNRRDTRSALIEAAERLLATRGFGGVTAVEITKEANARNNSAVRYHFGSMENLIRAVFESRLEALDAVRMEQLSALDQTDAGEDLPRLIDVMIRPLIDACRTESGRRYVRILNQLTTDPRFDLEELVGDRRPKSIAILTERIEHLLANLPVDIRKARLRQLNSIAATLLADHARQIERGVALNNDQAVREAAVTLAAFLTAPHGPL
ncbi:MAG: helix-turn-helix domain-containing protein [Pseudomonadota bacterium]